MKHISVYFSIFILFANIVFSQNKSEGICGIWLTPENRSAIHIFKSGKYYFGKISWAKNPFDKNGNPKKDIYNPDPKLRNRLLKGLIIMKNVSYDKRTKKGKGKIYNPENGKTYKMNIELVDANTLEVRGYIGIPLTGKTSVWERKK